MTTAHTTCPGCNGAKSGAEHLCRGCMVTLPRATRTALTRGDADAVQRLHEALTAGTPLHQISVQ